MSERYSWRYERPDVAEDEAERSTDFPTQADAEAWLAEGWADLADAGVTAVTLMREDAEVYGPMPLGA